MKSFTRLRSPALAIALALASAPACGGDDSSGADDGPGGGGGSGGATGVEPADVAGVYSVAVTNGTNGCNFADWQQGAVSKDIPLTVSQNGAHVSCTIDGVVGALVQLWLGSRGMNGELTGNELDLDLVGTNVQTSGACSYTIDLHVDATATGNALQGALVYTVATGGDQACAAFEGCETRQAFSGVRPPE